MSSEQQSPMSATQTINLRARFEELNAATSRDAQALAQAGQHVTLWNLVFAPLGVFLSVYIRQKHWCKGVKGFIHALFAAYEVFVRHAKLWEIQQEAKPTPPPRT